MFHRNSQNQNLLMARSYFGEGTKQSITFLYTIADTLKSLWYYFFENTYLLSFCWNRVVEINQTIVPFLHSWSQKAWIEENYYISIISFMSIDLKKKHFIIFCIHFTRSREKKCEDNEINTYFWKKKT
jgi:hypothetical protein